MALEFPPRKSFTASSGHEYSYIHLPCASNKPTLLFLHGFPSHIYDWAYQIKHFSSRGYGVLACDLLGYGGSSKETDISCYRMKPMSDELLQLLDSLDLPTVVGVGHDIGATLLSRFAAYHPTRFIGLVFLAVGPPKLGTPFDLDMINEFTKKAQGFELLGYFDWLARDEHAQATLEKHPEALMSLMFSADQGVWDEWFRPLGKMKEFVTDNKKLPIADWYTEEMQQQYLHTFDQKGGCSGPSCWPKMWHQNLFAKDEEGLEDVKLQQPSLFITPKEPVAAAAQQQQMLAEWVPNLTVVHVDSGHWVHLERSNESNAAIDEYLEKLN